MTSQFFNAGKNAILSGSIAPLTDTIKAALFTSSLTPNIDTQANFSDLSGEVSNAGYTAGGTALSTKSITTDTGNDRAYLDADDISFTASGASLTARYIVLYKSTGVGSTSKLLAIIDFGADRTVAAGDTMVLQWPAAASGAILYLS